MARAAGYTGSARNFRRLVAEEKAKWRKHHHRGRRPGVWLPGDILAFDWGEIGKLFVFCAVMALSRIRFVYFADNCGAEATMNALTALLRVPRRGAEDRLTDRMPCLKADTVAGLVVPTPAYVRFATHFGFRPDFCQAADPESKGLVENLVGYVKSDLMVPEELSVADVGNAWARAGGGGERPGALGDLCRSRRCASSTSASFSASCRRCGPSSARRRCARSTS